MVTGKQQPKKTSKSLRRLDLRLPEDHPIFSVPAGSRNKTAQVLLDAGLFVREELKNIAERLERLERLLEARAGAESAKENSFSLNEFFSCFEE